MCVCVYVVESLPVSCEFPACVREYVCMGMCEFVSVRNTISHTHIHIHPLTHTLKEAI